MLFQTNAFVGFYLCFFVAYHFLVESRRARLWLLVAGSAVFYASFSLGGIIPLIGSGAVTHALARAIGRSTGARRRRLLACALLANVGLWAFYRFGHWAVPSLAFPLGLAFYSLQNVSFALDVYRGAFTAEQSLLEFLASLTFFPHLLAGPIVRASFLVPQLERLETPEADRARGAFVLLARGVAKKSLADLLAPLVERVFAAPSGALSAWTGALAFAAQMYGDFAGYSDLAMGLSLLLGIELPRNFDLPYLARSPVDFWRRWHISLSTWFRDYVYYSFALGALKRHPYVNIIATMLVAGLWHGGGFSYLAFGVYHGLLLAGTQALALRLPRVARSRARLWRVTQVAITFYLVVIGMVLFRAAGLRGAVTMLREMHSLRGSVERGGLALLALAGASVVLGHAVDAALARRRAPAVEWIAAAIGFALAFALGGASKPFIYFQL